MCSLHDIFFLTCLTLLIVILLYSMLNSLLADIDFKLCF